LFQDKKKEENLHKLFEGKPFPYHPVLPFCFFSVKKKERRKIYSNFLKAKFTKTFFPYKEI